MPSEDYHKAMRQGLKEVKAAQALGEETGPRTLPDAPEKLAGAAEPWVWRRSPWSRSTVPATTFGGDAFSRRVSNPILPADHRVRRPSGAPCAASTWRRASGTLSRWWSTSTTSM